MQAEKKLLLRTMKTSGKAVRSPVSLVVKFCDF